MEEFTGAKERVFRNGPLRSLEADLTEAFRAAKEALPSAEPLPGLPELVGEGTLGDYIAACRRLNGLGLPPELSRKLGALDQNLRTLEGLWVQGRIGGAEAERAIVDIDTLRKCNRELIASIGEVVKIHEQGSAQREKAHEELVKIETELKQALLAAGSR